MKNLLLSALALAAFTMPSFAIDHCPRGQKRTATTTCIVDGDTIWLDGAKLRLVKYDTPETSLKLCGGKRERDLGKKAADRLKELLNNNFYTVDFHGKEGSGSRTLATVKVGGVNVGDILIKEGLARSWPDGDEFWCNR